MYYGHCTCMDYSSTAGVGQFLHGKFQVVDQRLAALEDARASSEALLATIVEDANKSNKELHDRLQALEAKNVDIEKQLQELKESPGSASTASTSASPANNTDDSATNTHFPYESRTQATIGGFQWNTSGSELTRKAIDLLQTAGVSSEDYKHLHAARDPGSTVILIFSSPSKLQEARIAVRCANYKDGQRFLWLDASKTCDELRPARLVHRAATALEDLESKFNVGDRQKIDKVMNGKQVKVGGIVMGYTHHGSWKWIKSAGDRYKNESGEMEVVTAWIESN